MKIGQLTEVIYRFQNEGRVNSTALTFKKPDILQMVKMAYSNITRLLAYEARKMNDGREYYFYSSELSIKSFPLSDADTRGMRRIDMSSEDLYMLPKNEHIPNVYPVGCGDPGRAITQVEPGEENFYIGDSKFDFFEFFVVKGMGLNTYHLPPCVKKLEVESTFDRPDINIPLDIGYNISTQILGITMRIPGFVGKDTDNSFSSPQTVQLKNRLQQQQEPTLT